MVSHIFLRNFYDTRTVTEIQNAILKKRIVQLADAANGLEYVHNLGTVHGDLEGVRSCR